MKNALRKFAGPHGPEASVVDGKLILSLPGARTPIVWQMDLAQAKASALEVADGADTTTLRLRNPKGDIVEIANFENRADAISGLMAASRALKNAHGHIRPLASESGGVAMAAPAVKRRAAPGRWAMAIFGVLILFVLIGMWGSMLPRTPGMAGAPTAAPQAGNPAGVPLSADDFLRNR